MTYELFQQGPAVYIPILLLSLAITIVAYGAFPIIFARVRKKPITKKKYKRLCYSINVAVMFLFIIISSEVSNGVPYLLWTWVFSSRGIKVLGTRGIMVDSGYLKDDPHRMTECTSCGYRDKDYFDACPKCGKYAKQYVYLNQDSPASNIKAVKTLETPALHIDKSSPEEDAKYLVAEQLGETYVAKENQKSRKKTKISFCSQCGTQIDPVIKRCTGCGKQYFRGFRFTKFSVTVIALALVIATVSTLYVLQYINTQELKDEIKGLERQVSAEQSTINRLEGEIDDLEQQVSSKQTITNRLENEIYVLEQQVSARQSKINRLENEIDDLESELGDYKDLVNFVDKYVVFVEDDGTNYYHKYECPKFKGNGFWAFNIDAAKEKYTACPYCH